MAGKRKPKRATAQHEDLSKPSKWRLQHGSFEGPVRMDDPETGTPVAHRRAVDTLGAMLANGTITQAMHDAGAVFRAQFRAAALDTVRASPLIRIPGGTGDPLTERNVDARRKVAAALDALGSQDSAAGSCAWHVLGCEASVREWAARQGWGGKLVGHSQAQGILVATLGVLAWHYGLDKGRPGPANRPGAELGTERGRHP
ncbi:hypothetical protein JYK14_03095 [Siccirubricoccus sp. KC 17139]|uniref:Uncharacterized protein n=1 Tax=Siccirubricoccus soli TaxID=2899147 RepID=A0ABT1CZT3_9PROT|nr:hypothetical protein [Siccirubricoccus soli]MCO6415162.1 hypothetical protein [Siccirubricoccus soli]MCP2681293.1 hypothetical protein [Siccirubricoccus soli]